MAMILRNLYPRKHQHTLDKMTVKETLDFSARCQGVGFRYGEKIVGPTKTLFMDEISTGIDSSTTFQIVKCLQQIVHLTDVTILMFLLQPAPETFDLFADIILLSEGEIVYQGPREHVLEFFETCGFKCPERKGVADFLQEVLQAIIVDIPDPTNGTGLFRLIAGVCRKMVIAHTGGSLTLLLVFLLGGFILPKARWHHLRLPPPRIDGLLTAMVIITAAGKPKAITSKKQARNMEPDQEEGKESVRLITNGNNSRVLTALMGVSGAGKTTLMDVLAGRKIGDYIEGDIRISGFPKRQETFARVSGYFEQTDIHSPQVTVRESLIFSAFLRLPKEIFVDEVMDLVELDNLKDGIVGLPGVSGLSAEQRKRLTIAVELVANPSIIFMDKPTSGLDARAAAIVVRNTVDTGRTVVCTIHQPSIDIFEELDEAITAVPKIKEKNNPATWMLEVSSVNSEIRLGIGFAEYYNSSASYQETSSDIMTIIGAMYTAVLFVGINNCSTVQAIVAVGRTVFYRERAAGMYSALPYAMAQRIPKWWIWYYCICPVAWTVYGCMVSQYGDVEDTIKVSGMSIDPMTKDYITDHFGYNPNFMGQVAIVLLIEAEVVCFQVAVLQWLHLKSVFVIINELEEGFIDAIKNVLPEAKKRFCAKQLNKKSQILEHEEAVLVVLSEVCVVDVNGDDGYEVLEGQDKYIVKLERRRCTCRMWDIFWIPCPHAIRALLYLKKDPLNEIHWWYTKEVYILTYHHKIQLVPNEKLWTVDPAHAMDPPDMMTLAERPRVKRTRGKMKLLRGKVCGVSPGKAGS
ncbi:hypothetical protein RND71_021718 [Anisodus tanguticus]|uniref:ABC transporter domain-containing protein n=1 Tax=Anisodus tanguticus TaxID=243964 RepID=A0AAE1RVN2_9SOLA|nr:hypothetical protein RND71_021718 [Anisodus tanguticus]